MPSDWYYFEKHSAEILLLFLFFFAKLRHFLLHVNHVSCIDQTKSTMRRSLSEKN